MYKLCSFPLLLFGTCFVLPNISHARSAPQVQADITAGSDHHVVVSPGEVNSATVHWSTTPPTSVSLSVEVNGGTPSPITIPDTGSGSFSYSPIDADSHYVFTLDYADGIETKSVWTSVTSQQQPSAHFGFNYWPGGMSCAILNDSNWINGGAQALVAADLDHMCSLGARELRLMFWVSLAGWVEQNGQLVLTPHWLEQQANLPALLAMCADRDIRVILSFANNYFDSWPSASPNTRWWMQYYGGGVDESDGMAEFVADSAEWINGYVTAVEASPYRQTVMYYDYQNELSDFHPRANEYLRGIYDAVVAPPGKRGLSVLHCNPQGLTDVPYVRTALGNRRLDYLEFHSFFQLHNPNMSGAYAHAQSIFPDTTVLLGEFGMESKRQCASVNETAQLNGILSQANLAQSLGIPYYLNWQLWDNTPPVDPNCTNCMDCWPNSNGWGGSNDDPKHVMGRMAVETGHLVNPDFELGSALPGWMGGGSAGAVFVAAGPNTVDAASGAHYGRVQVHAPSETAWMLSDPIPTDGASRVYLNGFVRSNMAVVQFGFIELDQFGTVLAMQGSPSIIPVGWSWRNVLHLVGPWANPLNPLTTHIRVAVNGTASSSASTTNSYLDLDTVSIDLR